MDKFTLEFRPKEQHLLAALQAYLAPFQEVLQPSRSGHHQVAASLDLTQLVSDIGATVDHTGTHLDTKCEKRKSINAIYNFTLVR